MRLLRDSEAEVRVAAAGKVSAFSKLLTAPQIVTSVIPCVRELSMDSSQYVRAALAGVVMEMAPVLGKQLTIEHLVPIFLTLLKDVYPDVRLNVISKLDQVRGCREDKEWVFARVIRRWDATGGPIVCMAMLVSMCAILRPLHGTLGCRTGRSDLEAD